MPADVRAIANFVLDVAEEEGVEVTNLALNKIVYFLHAESLVHEGEPLISAKIEAWKYGPVFREIYGEFKAFGAKPISSRAQRINKLTGDSEVCTLDATEQDSNKLRETCLPYLRLSASQLVNLSHVRGGAWDAVFHHDGKSNPGMAITDTIIRRHFAQRTFH